MVLVEEGSSAHFECFVDANPVNEHVITWKRRKNDSESIVLSSPSSFDEEESTVFNRMHTDVEILSSEEASGGGLFADGAKMKGTLVIVNATLADSGTSFDCLADNGVGKRSKSTMTLLVLRKFHSSCVSLVFQTVSLTFFYMQIKHMQLVTWHVHSKFCLQICSCLRCPCVHARLAKLHLLSTTK